MTNIAKDYLSVAGIEVDVILKDIRHLHISVYPPFGRVRVAAPLATSDDVVRLAIVQRLPWIKEQRKQFLGALRQPKRSLRSGESHFAWGIRYILDASTTDVKSKVEIRGQTLFVISPDGSSASYKAKVLDVWYRKSLLASAQALLEKWEPLLGVQASKLRIRRMKTKWGTCVPSTGVIWLNSELAKKNPRCLEYILVHELVHLLERGHTDAFTALLDQHMPDWRIRRDELNAFPLASEDWKS